ncbi:MAG: hypothetical protein ACHP9T_06730 [Caulobacterales bacterium]
MTKSRALSVSLAAAGWLALAAAAAAAPAGWSPPRAADGHPDLSGVWSNASVTHLTRPPGMARPVLSEAEAKAYAKSNPQVMRLDADARPSDAEGGAPPPGDPGGYNAYWLDPGRTLGQVQGQYRTAWIVDPADGQLPFSPAGRKRVAQANAYARAADTPAGPDAMQPWDRCLIASRGSGGPGMLNNIYNSNYQIVQTPGAVAIVVEMIHDARTIPIFRDKAAAQAGHGPAALHPWLGDSTGWWDGDTLVVETVNVNAEQGRAGPIFLTPQGQVTERFTRASQGQIFYEFQVDDPAYYARPWRAEMSLNASQGLLFEYACHEGNYALPDILRGVRAAEAKAVADGK